MVVLRSGPGEGATVDHWESVDVRCLHLDNCPAERPFEFGVWPIGPRDVRDRGVVPRGPWKRRDVIEHHAAEVVAWSTTGTTRRRNSMMCSSGGRASVHGSGLRRPRRSREHCPDGNRRLYRARREGLTEVWQFIEKGWSFFIGVPLVAAPSAA